MDGLAGFRHPGSGIRQAKTYRLSVFLTDALKTERMDGGGVCRLRCGMNWMVQLLMIFRSSALCSPAYPALYREYVGPGFQLV